MGTPQKGWFAATHDTPDEAQLAYDMALLDYTSQRAN